MLFVFEFLMFLLLKLLLLCFGQDVLPVIVEVFDNVILLFHDDVTDSSVLFL